MPDSVTLPIAGDPIAGHAIAGDPIAGATLAALAVIVFAAFTVESAIGFGATVVTVALASFIAPIEAILPSFVPINMILSGYLTLRYRRDVDRRLLFRRIVPLMGLGLPIGVMLFRHLGSSRLKLAFGVLVALLSIVELRRARTTAPGRAPGPLVGGALLVAAGVIHGAFVTGGPLAVYVTGRELADKARFRATLSALWLSLNGALIVSYYLDGKLGRGSLGVSAALVLPLFAGMALGEQLHRRVPEERFRTLVFALLLAAGLLLVARSI